MLLLLLFRGGNENMNELLEDTKKLFLYKTDEIFGDIYYSFIEEGYKGGHKYRFRLTENEFRKLFKRVY